jgi:hypothetical protein
VAHAATERGPEQPTAQTRRPLAGIAVFAVVVALWGAFLTLIVAAPAALDDIWRWVRDLPLVLELGAWLVALPWLLALAVWQSDWTGWLQGVVITLIVLGWTVAFAPRVPE